MKATMTSVWNDARSHGPNGHPAGSVSHDIDPAKVLEVLGESYRWWSPRLQGTLLTFSIGPWANSRIEVDAELAHTIAEKLK